MPPANTHQRNHAYISFFGRARECLEKAFPRATNNQLTSVVGRMWNEIKHGQLDAATYPIIQKGELFLHEAARADIWEELTLSAMGRECDRWALMEWVNANMMVAPEKIDRDKVPSQGAPHLLKHFRDNPKDFAKVYLSKVEAPEKEGDDEESILAEDSLSIEEILIQFKRLVAEQEQIDEQDAVLSSGSQGRAGERGLAADAAAAGEAQ